MGELGRVMATLQKVRFFPHFVSSARVLKVTFPENRIAISGITLSSEIYLDEMVIFIP